MEEQDERGNATRSDRNGKGLWVPQERFWCDVVRGGGGRGGKGVGNVLDDDLGKRSSLDFDISELGHK